jgi:AraC-like DNA-binding protein
MLLFINSEPLADVANLNTNVAIISKTINQGFKVLIFYRIEAIKQAFAAGEHKNTTRYRFFGFNSKATFNRAFKKVQAKL